MTQQRAGTVLGLLADHERLRVFAAVALGAVSADEVRAATGLGARATARALTRLEAAGLLEWTKSGLAVRLDELREAALEVTPRKAADEHAHEHPEDAKILRAFIRGGKLVSIPAARVKRLTVLDYLAQEFEPGQRYTEKDVNAILRRWHADYASLRRYMVDEQILSREHGLYWRSGGTFEVD
jgi:hypothetical protein